MEQKTKVIAKDGVQEIWITREFNLPVELLFRAYTEAEFVSQWMGTTVQKLEAKQHGSYRFETRGKNGEILLKSHGVIHDFVPNQFIARTFEMEGTPFPVQMEYLDFVSISEEKSMLKMQVLYKSVQVRDEILKMPFVVGINMAHNKLENTFKA